METIFNVVIPIIGALAFIAGVVLYVKGRDDANCFDSELRYLIACIRLFPLSDMAFKSIQDQFRKVNKIKGRDREKISVAFSEFAFKYRQFFPALGTEAEIKNTE